MQVKNLIVDPKNRPVIVVGTEKGLKKLVSSIIDSYPHISKIIDFSRPTKIRNSLRSLIRINLADIAKLMGNYDKNKTEKSLLDVLEIWLELDYKIYWYEPSEAIRLFKFDVGHVPSDGEILVQHPIELNRYILPFDYTRRLCREKEAAFRQLVAELGAKEIRLTSAEIKEKRGWFGGSIPLSEASAQVGVKAEFDHSGGFKKSVYSRFGKPNFSPKVSFELQKWVDSDPDFQTIVHGRMIANLEYEKVSLEFSEKMGMGGTIAAKMADTGVFFQGKYEKIFHSIWHYEIEYWPVYDDKNNPQNPQNPALFTLHLSNNFIALKENTKLQESFIVGLTSLNSDGIIAQVIQKPDNPKILGLQNLSNTIWTAKTPKGKILQIKPNKRITLAVDTEINFGSIKGKIE